MSQTATQPTEQHLCHYVPWASDPRYWLCTGCPAVLFHSGGPDGEQGPQDRSPAQPTRKRGSRGGSGAQPPRFAVGQRVRIAAQPGCSDTVRIHHDWPGEVLRVSRYFNGHRFYSVRLRNLNSAWGGWLAGISVRECDLTAVTA